jgi:hypothetical protein
MWTWILICLLITGLSAALLELFREDTESAPADSNGRQVGLPDPSLGWERMTESDLDALLEEFALAGAEPYAAHGRLSI